MTNLKKSGHEQPYDVGYGKPPKQTRFQAGKSGNPKGRPKGAANFTTVIEQELNALVSVTENGISKKIKKKQIVAKQLVNKAAGGDLKATSLLLNESRMAEQSAAGQILPMTASFAPEDKLVMNSLIQRIQQTSPLLLQTPDTSTAPAASDTPLHQQEQE
ncbi:MAG: DUF5681 domain-containing protein [Burkholderiaceae bacterium]